MNEVKLTIRDLAIKFVDTLRVSVNKFVEAGKLIVEAMDNYPEQWESEFRSLYPALMNNNTLIRRLEAIGRGKLIPEVMTSDLTENQKLLVESLPIDVQYKVIEGEKVTVYNPYNNQPDKVPLKKLSGKQFNIIYDIESRTVRSLDEQRKYYDDNFGDNPRKDKNSPIVNEDGTILFPKKLFTISELERLIEKAREAKSEYRRKLHV